MNSEICIQQLITDLNDLCKKLDDKYIVNSGGCCYLAACIAENLNKLEIKYKVCIYDRYMEYPRALTYRYKIKNNMLGTVSHIYLKIGKNYINKGIGKFKKTKAVAYINSDELYTYYYNNIAGWNRTYSIHNNKIIKHIIDEYFSKISA